MKLKTQVMPKLVCPILMFAITASAANKTTSFNAFKKAISITNFNHAAETITGTITNNSHQPLPGAIELSPSAYKYRITS